ncbi:serine/threonine-protein kinase Cx32 [Spatholobus suberectus]|nr:serine/threonine-protein kinase Cx32 [Spatholobus suberectus]
MPRSASTDSKSVGFSASTSSTGKSQFSEIASGSIEGGEGSLPDGQILKWPNLKVFSFRELKSATKSFRFDTLLGEGSFGRVYKGWLNEKTLTPAKAGSGMVVAIKKMHLDGLQGFEEWQIYCELSGTTVNGSADGEGSLPDGRILKWPNLKVFSFEELKSATRNFKYDAVLVGEGGFESSGKVFKGWLDGKTLTPTKAGFGMVVSIKMFNPETERLGFQEWQVVSYEG